MNADLCNEVSEAKGKAKIAVLKAIEKAADQGPVVEREIGAGRTRAPFGDVADEPERNPVLLEPGENLSGHGWMSSLASALVALG